MKKLLIIEVWRVTLSIISKTRRSRMDKDITNSTFKKVLERFPFESFCAIINENGTDKYIKKLFATKLFYIMFIAQINQVESLRALSAKVSNDINLQNAIALESISAAQISRRLKNISSDFWAAVFTNVAQLVTMKTTGNNQLPKGDRINIIDASTIILCLNSYLWADFRKTKAGVKIHQRVVYQDGVTFPDKAVLTTARKSDKSQLDELLVTDEGALNVFDRGYVDYGKWDEYSEAGIRFVTRSKSNYIISIVEEKQIPGNGDMSESVVLLGDPKRTIMRHRLRLIHIKDSVGKQVDILTNDFSLSAFEITEIYRRRWKIELFFKWIKQHLKVKILYGKSANAVYSQIWLALITFCVLLLTKIGLKTKKTLFDIKRILTDTMFEPLATFLSALRRQSSKLSKGRQCTDHNKEYEQLLRQVELESSDFLDVNDVDLYYA